jgi:hypothetical protein
MTMTQFLVFSFKFLVSPHPPRIAGGRVEFKIQNSKFKIFTLETR